MITLLVFDIEVEAGWAVGTVSTGDPAIDQDLVTDVSGRPWVPGSSLAGSLRAHLADVDAATGTDLETRLMGSRPPTGHEEQTTPSPLWLLGTCYTPHGIAEAVETEVVGQTAIDRRRGGAAAKSLRHSRLVSSAGTLTAYLRHDGTLGDDELATLARWRPAIGGGRSVGGGRCRLLAMRHGTVDPTTAEGMRTWLTHTGHTLFDVVATQELSGAAHRQPWLRVDLLVQDALLVADPRPTGPATPRTRNGQPLVPGSAWKGLFRSRAEYILRSLYGEDAVCQRAPGCGTCLTCDLFGHPKGRSRLAFGDCVVETATTAPPRTHVGIDRVTGGAHDGLLFQTQPVTAGRLTLRIDTLDTVDAWVRPLLLHVLRDLHDGLIGIGSRVTRGMGGLRLADPDAALAALVPVRIPQFDATSSTSMQEQEIRP